MFLISPDYWEVRQTPHKGRGIFAKKIIQGGTVLGDFMGKILPPEQDVLKGPFYSMHYNEKAIIMPDPSKEGIHLVNHSCMPTCDMYPYKGHAVLFALRKIFPGEELTFTYLCDPPTDNREPTEMYWCRCGSILCHGTMNATKNIIEKTDKFVHEINEDTYENTLPVPYGEELQPFESYPEKIEDHPIYDMSGTTVQPPLKLQETKIPSLQFVRNTMRETGLQLDFTNLNIVIIGIMDGLILSKIEHE